MAGGAHDRRPAARAATAATLGLLLAGCVVGPKYHRPAPPPAAALPAPGSLELSGQRVAPGLAVEARWWTGFGSPELNALIDRALAHNADVEAAQGALRQARESWLAARGGYAPSVDLALGASRQKNPGYLASPLSSNANIFDLYSAQVSVGYVVDVFGAQRRQVQQAAAGVDAQRFQLEATGLALTANLAAAAIQEAAVRDQIAANERLVASQAELLALLKRQFSAGQAARSDVEAQALVLTQAQAALPPLIRQRDQLRDQIAALGGGYPTDPQPKIEFASLAAPADLPDALPARLVEQRPDIRMAEANLRIANAAVGIAQAQRLPSITLTAAAGGQSGSLGTLLSQGNEAWIVGAGLAQPVFQGFALKHRQRAAEAALDQARAQYRSTVITGCQNVADALHALESDSQALKVADAGEAAARAALETTRRRYAAGEAGSITVFAADQAHEQALIGQSQAKAQQLVDTVALYQALGGGWESRKAVAAR